MATLIERLIDGFAHVGSSIKNIRKVPTGAVAGDILQAGDDDAYSWTSPRVIVTNTLPATVTAPTIAFKIEGDSCGLWLLTP